MTNILTDQLPTAVLVGGKEVGINSDFRTCLRVVMAFEDDELTPEEKQAILLENIYPVIPAESQEAIEQAARFLLGDESRPDEDDAPFRTYSFAKDATLIYAGFRKVHGVDLSTASLHWWAFRAMFVDLLGEGTVFGGLVNLRHRVKSGKATPEEREAANQMGDLFELSDTDTRSLEEKEADEEFLRLQRGL